MKLYLVTDVENDGDIIGIYSSLEKAQSSANSVATRRGEFINDWRLEVGDWYGRSANSTFSVEEFELDAEKDRS